VLDPKSPISLRQNAPSLHERDYTENIYIRRRDYYIIKDIVIPNKPEDPSNTSKKENREAAGLPLYTL
jgi:hypothetical protein